MAAGALPRLPRVPEELTVMQVPETGLKGVAA